MDYVWGFQTEETPNHYLIHHARQALLQIFNTLDIDISYDRPLLVLV